ncbi:Uncharacterised protein [Oligella urethralis]|uniref:Uncharacterized protein n=1 Tax=Oligella urethralis TaxID=90245 RepID=A0A2X1UIH8_9BURK|nr:Uncharacterised protein [Oligella urethralis]
MRMQAQAGCPRHSITCSRVRVTRSEGREQFYIDVRRIYKFTKKV